MRLTHPDVLLANNRDISQQAFRRAVGLRRRIAEAVERREAYVAANRLEPAFCLPAGNWGAGAANDFVNAYRHVRDGDYDVLNRLRLWVPFFSGYNLMWLSGDPGRPSVSSIPPDYDQWIVENRPKPDHWVELWIEYTKWIPPALRFSPPAMMGEIGWRVDGIVVNHDTYAYQERINILYEAGIIDWLWRLGHAPRILEIGGGYGALAFALRRLCPEAVYVICDLPESLMFSGLYLTLCEQDDTRVVEPGDDVGAHLSRAGVALLPNYMLHALLDQRAAFGLVLNTLSMSEMAEAQVHGYAAAIAQLIGRAGVFFEQNQDNRHIGLLDSKDHIRSHFAWRRRLAPRLADLSEGRADLWANVEPPSLRPVAVIGAPARRRRLARAVRRAKRRLFGG